MRLEEVSGRSWKAGRCNHSSRHAFHGQNVVEYESTYSVQGENCHTKYEVDIVNTTQTSTVTGHVRRLLCVAMLALELDDTDNSQY